MAEGTPMMLQYNKIKADHPDCLLFFRLGDFYEMFHDDAKRGAEELGLTLTTRDRGKPEDERTPMCGVPYHSCDGYIARLIAKGYKVAICEQTEDPAQAKGLVDRDIIRVVTPGTVIASSMLEDSKNNYICAVYADSAAYGLCLCDISTGEVYASSFPAGAEGLGHLQNELGRFHPAEAVLSSGAWSTEGLVPFLKERLSCLCENGGEARFRAGTARPLAEKQFKTGLTDAPEGDEAVVQAAGGLLAYLYETQKTDLSHISRFNYYTVGQFMELDLTARQTLELTATMRGKEKKGSLLWVLDRTQTSMGGRCLRSWLERPLLNVAAITRRSGAVAALVENTIGREELTAAQEREPEFRGLCRELEGMLGRVFSDNDLKCLYTIYDYLGFPTEVILLLTGWAIRRERRQKNNPAACPRMPSVQREAFRWKRLGLDTLERAEEYLRRQEAVDQREWAILQAVGVAERRPAVEKERSFIGSWVELGFSDELIRLAYERTVYQKGAMNWPYMNKILLSWRQAGYQTPAQVEAEDRPPRRTRAAAPRPQDVQPSQERIQKNADWLDQFLEEQKKGRE